ncbi:MAG TPA: hypothetical protein VLR90_01470 [Blastocatellia bacterium]|nr:hypothetical protein [Blastocatellia bacterium]
MKIKLSLACLFIVAAFPLLASTAHNPAPFASVALAGHTNLGGGVWCQCGCAGCFCDPGETPGACTNSINPIPKKSDRSFDQSASPVGKASTSDFDFGAGTMLLALAFLVWMRLRG